MSIQIESDLKEILERIEKRFDKIDADNKDLREVVTNIDKRLIKVETKLDSELPAIHKSIDEIKGSQKAQIWTLIGILFTAVTGIVVVFGRFIISGNI